MRRGRRRRKVGKHISLSATDADWETVRSNAKRRGLSIARYLVELVERDASEEGAGLELTLAAEDAVPLVRTCRSGSRELLEAVREVRALMLEGEDAGPLVRDMQERIAVQFDAWASALAAILKRPDQRCRSRRAARKSCARRWAGWWARNGRASLGGPGRGLGRAVCREAGEGSAGSDKGRGRRWEDGTPCQNRLL